MRYRILASLGLALVAAPALADAQQPPPDTTRSGVVRAEARGEVMLDANRGLTRAQVRQLQESLQRAGCNPGTPDGVFGPRTRQALACVRRQRGIESANTNDVLRSLDLGFTLSDSVAGAGEVVASAEGGAPNYGDPTFVRDTGVMMINTDTMPAGLLENSSVFVPSVTRSRGLYLRETSLDRRSRDVLVPVDSTRRPPPPPSAATPTRRDSAAVMRADTVPAARRDSTPVIRRDSIPALRRDTTPAVRRDSVPATRRDSTPTPAVRRDTVPTTRLDSTVRQADSLLRRADSLLTTPRDTTMRRADTTRTTLPDSTIRRMRDELLLTLPPRPDSARDTTRPDTTRARPDSTKTPPDTTRRRIPPPR